jgi:predicted nucleic acid-binding protein
MILYLDSSALVKLYIAEPGSDLVSASIAEATATYTHLIAYVEVRAAFAKALRVGLETAEGLVGHKREFETTWQQLDVVLPDETTVRRAGDLAEQFGLRGYDSVHLSAAESIWRQTDPGADFRFCAFDRALTDAARSIGLSEIAG